MNSHLPYIVPQYVVLIGWLCFGAIFFQRKRYRERAKWIDRASIAGVILQMLGFLFVWAIWRWPYLSILPLGLWFQLVVCAIVIVLVIASLWMTSAAVRVLGKQWSLQARVLEGHALIREGPYRFVRHPIYTGMLGMLIATGLACSRWIGFVIALMLYGVGSAIRIRSEEKLLREQFGEKFDDYKRNVPAVIPFKFSR